MKQDLKLVIGMPTYNGAKIVGETLESILCQSFQDFEIIVSDDYSKDKTIEVIEGFGDKRIKIFRNEKNLGCAKNLQRLRELARDCDILFLMAQDDILLKDGLLKTYSAFLLNEDIGAVTRPYYWFDEDVRKPVRAMFPYDENKDTVLSIFDGQRAVQKIFESVGQCSGLAYRIKYLTTDFHDEIFPTHIYPFAAITKKHKIVFLKDFTIAVRISSSQTRFKSSIYRFSPTLSWVNMFKNVYQGEKYQSAREAGIEQITRHFVGLVQIRNYGRFRDFLHEVGIFVKVRPLNILNPKFWFFALGCLLTPPALLRFLVDWYKNKINSRHLSNFRLLLVNH